MKSLDIDFTEQAADVSRGFWVPDLESDEYKHGRIFLDRHVGHVGLSRTEVHFARDVYQEVVHEHGVNHERMSNNLAAALLVNRALARVCQRDEDAKKVEIVDISPKPGPWSSLSIAWKYMEAKNPSFSTYSHIDIGEGAKDEHIAVLKHEFAGHQEGVVQMVSRGMTSDMYVRFVTGPEDEKVMFFKRAITGLMDDLSGEFPVTTHPLNGLTEL